MMLVNRPPGLRIESTSISMGSLAMFLERVSAMLPLRRIGEPDEIAGAAMFLSSPAAAYVTGQVLQVCGGSSVV